MPVPIRVCVSDQWSVEAQFRASNAAADSIPFYDLSQEYLSHHCGHKDLPGPHGRIYPEGVGG